MNKSEFGRIRVVAIILVLFFVSLSTVHAVSSVGAPTVMIRNGRINNARLARPAAAPSQTCGNGIVEGTEVCDSNFTVPCGRGIGCIYTSYEGGYVGNGTTCVVSGADMGCNSTCTVCGNCNTGPACP